MNKTPLLAAHLAANATLANESGWMVPTSFGDPDQSVAAARAGAICLDLSWVDVLDLQAPDLRRWANGMFTNTVTKLPAGRGNRHAMCDDRGRVLGLLDLYCDSDQHFIAALEGVDADWFMGHFRMFLILDDIEVEPRPNDEIVVTVQGPAAASVLESAGLPAPPVERAHVVDPSTGVRIARRDRTGLGGFDLLVPSEHASAIWTAVQAAGATPAGTETLDALRILAGRASWPQDGTAKSMVHELGLNDDVCNFEKGCYLGQEIINRIDVRGGITKRLTGMSLDRPVPLGSTVHVGDTAVGAITSLTQFGGQTVALGVLRKSAWDPGVAISVGVGDAAVPGTVIDLPS